MVATDSPAVVERLRCIHILERRMHELSRQLRYVEADDAQRKDWESQHKALAEAAAELRQIKFEGDS